MDDFKRPTNTTPHTVQTPAIDEKPAKKSKGPKRSGKMKLLLALIVVLLVLALAGIGFLLKKYNDTRQEVQKLSTVQGQQELNQTQTNQLLGEMRAIIVLPSGEDPVVATITDINQLKDKDFYKDAENGDRVVVFPNAKKAYIYRPSTKTIINVGAFQVDTNAQADTGQTQTSN